MPFSSGTFSVVYNWTTESGAPPIEIAKLDTQHADFATGLSNCILRDGSGLPTAAIPWNSQNLTGVAQLEAQRFVPTGSTVPSNGMYLSAANTLAWASNTTFRGSVNSTGNWTIAAPSSGVTLAVSGVAGGALQTINDGTINVQLGTVSSTAAFVSVSTAHALRFRTNATDRIDVGSGGNVVISAPSSGTTLAVSGIANGVMQTWNDGTINVQVGMAGSTHAFLSASTNHGLRFRTNASDRIEVAAAGNVTINAPSSGVSLTVTAPSGGSAVSFSDGTIGGTINFGGSVLQIGTTSSHGVQIATANTSRIAVAAAGNVTVNAPSSGPALTVSGGTGGQALFNGTASAGNSAILSLTDGQSGTRQWLVSSGIPSAGDFSIRDNTASANRVVITSTGNVTVNAPSSGTALTVTGVAGGAGAIINGSVHTPPVAVTFSATAMTLNCTLSNVFTTTFTANVTTAPTLSNPQDGQTINWFITQDATGSRTMTWPSTFRWPGGVAGVLSTAANAVDLMVATYRSGPNAWYASLSKGFA